MPTKVFATGDLNGAVSSNAMPRHSDPTPENFRRPINFQPSEDDRARLEWLFNRTALRGASVVRRALKALEVQERANEAAEKAGQKAREKGSVAA